jgi:hypothetical protein
MVYFHPIIPQSPTAEKPQSHEVAKYFSLWISIQAKPSSCDAVQNRVKLALDRAKYITEKYQAHVGYLT